MRELAKESYVYTVQGKRKTVQRKDMGNFSIAVCDLPTSLQFFVMYCIYGKDISYKYYRNSLVHILDLAVESVDPLAFLEGKIPF